MKKIVIVLVILALLIVGYMLINQTEDVAVQEGTAREQARQEAQKKITEPDADVEADMQAEANGGTDTMGDKAVYTTYTEGVVGNGQESVLFFHADWCPKCRANDIKLSSWYQNNSYGRSTYKLDYDANVELRTQLGVTSQDTFVLIDGEGNVVKQLTFPSVGDLEDILG